MSIAIGVLIALFAQATCLHSLRWHDGVISAVMIPIVMATHRLGRRDVVMIGALSGFAEDILCGTGFAWTLATVVSLLIVNRVAQMVDFERLPFVIAAIASATLLRDLVFWTIAAVNGAPPALFMHDVHMSVWSALLTAGAALALAPALGRVYASS